MLVERENDGWSLKDAQEVKLRLESARMRGVGRLSGVEGIVVNGEVVERCSEFVVAEVQLTIELDEDEKNVMWELKAVAGPLD